jgi:hypothetical protein
VHALKLDKAFMASARALVVVSGSVPGNSVVSTLDKAGLSLSQAQVCAQAPSDGSKYSTAVLFLDAPQSALLGATARALSPSGTLMVYADQQHHEQILRDLVLNGYVECSSSDTLVSARMPSYEVGSKSSIQMKSRATPTTAAAGASTTWSLPADDEEEELVDDELLLTEADKQLPAKAAADDCEVGASGRKACKNCSCGRAEAEGKPVKLTQDMLDNPVSSCGNCSLGDAFRCAGCPYRGLPAFEAGKKIQLASDFLTADA